MASPAPTPPPIPGNRASRLLELFDTCLQRTLEKLSYDNLATCFPTIARRAPPILEQVQTQIVAKLKEKSAREFQSILATRQVITRLNALEGLLADAEARRLQHTGAPPLAPHTLPAGDVLSGHLGALLAPHREVLVARLADVQAGNARLLEQVKGQRAEMEVLLRGLDGAVDDVRAANAVLGPVVDELAAEARVVDAELKGVSGL